VEHTTLPYQIAQVGVGSASMPCMVERAYWLATLCG